MGSRGPQPGFKQARAEQAALVPAQSTEAAVEQSAAASPLPVLSASDRENPDKITGQALRDLAHRRGLAKSILPSMSDEKIREQLRYMTYNQYEQDAVA